jgi:DNA-binding NarL/FixJ family response regulator
VVDDHPLFLGGMATLLRRFERDVQVHTATSAEEGLATARARELDLVLIDLRLPGMDGMTAIGEFHRQNPALPVVVLSATEQPEDIARAVASGALGLIPKTSSTRALFAALRQVLDGNVFIPFEPVEADAGPRAAADGGEPDAPSSSLSLRQMEVLALLCQGMTNRQIADGLELSEKTVKTHVTCIFRALGVVNRTQALLAARRTGMIAE